VNRFPIPRSHKFRTHLPPLLSRERDRGFYMETVLTRQTLEKGSDPETDPRAIDCKGLTIGNSPTVSPIRTMQTRHRSRKRVASDLRSETTPRPKPL
jgi:hypothetical protein